VKYVLFQPVSKGRLYPAKITAKNGEYVTLAWHPGNVYMRGEAPMSPTFSRMVGECSDALEYSNLNAISRFRVCLKWIYSLLATTDANTVRLEPSTGHSDYAMRWHFMATQTIASRRHSMMPFPPFLIFWLKQHPTCLHSSLMHTCKRCRRGLRPITSEKLWTKIYMA